MLNAVCLMGRLTADPELRHTPNNVAVTSFSIAVDRSFAKSGTDKVTDFIDIVAWRNTAEFICKYFQKGQMMAIQGSIQARSYQDKDGNKRKSVEVLADNVYFADSKKSSSSNREDAQETAARNNENLGSFETDNTDDFREIPADDDLPF